MEEKLKRNIPLFYAYHALNAGLFMVPIWVIYQQKFLTFTQMAFFNAFFFFMIVAFELPTGAFADIVGRKYSMILGSLINAVGFIILGLNPSVTGIIVKSIANGLGASLISGANQSLVFDSLKELGQEKKYPSIWAKASLMFQITGSITIILGSYAFSYFDGLPYILRGVLFIMSILPAFLLTEPHIDSEKFTLKNYIGQIKEGVREIFKNSYVSRLSIFFVLVGGIALSNQRFFLQPFMVEKGLGDVARGWIASGIKLFISMLTVFLTSRKKLFESKYFLLLLPAIMILSLVPSQVVALPLLILILVGIALPSGSKNTFLGYPIQKALSSKNRSTGLSALNMFTSAVYMINNFVGGAVTEGYSVGIHYMLVGLFILFVVAPLGISVINRKREP